MSTIYTHASGGSEPKKISSKFKEIVTSLKQFLSHAGQIDDLVLENLSKSKREEIIHDFEEISLLIHKLKDTVQLNDQDVVQIALKQSLESLEVLVNNKTLIESKELTSLLGCTRQALSKANTQRRFFSLKIKGKTFFPAFFADPIYDRKQLEAISKKLGDLSGNSKLQFMLTPKGSLGGLTPLEALSKGRYQDVLVAAEGFAKR